jgi:hypothetical protein
MSSEALPALRKAPGPVPAPLPLTFLKQADEQTVAGLAAVCRAAQVHGLDLSSQAEWGVIAAPELPGRTGMAAALQAYAREGAWGISPHLIPHRSLHSLSGTVSQALGLHGTNYGVGGGPGALAESLLAAGALLADGRLPGLWVVLTSATEAQSGTGSAWQAAALALVPDVEECVNKNPRPLPGLLLGVRPLPAEAAGPASWTPLTLEGLVALLADKRDLPEAHWLLGPVGWARLLPASRYTEDRP